MNMFALEHEIDYFDSEVLIPNASRLASLVQLAWDLRLRDTRRAYALTEQIEKLLPDSPINGSERQCIVARLYLVRAEVKWASGEREGAKTLALSALNIFRREEDSTGCTDAYWILGLTAHDQTDHAGAQAALREAVGWADRAEDTFRRETATVASAYFALVDGSQPAIDWHEKIAAAGAYGHPALLAWAKLMQGTIAGEAQDHVEAIVHGAGAYDAALYTGQMRVAILACRVIAVEFSNLNDYQATLEWLQRERILLRSLERTADLGACLIRMVSAALAFDLVQEAERLIAEATATINEAGDAYQWSLLLKMVGELALRQEDAARALAKFVELEKRADYLGQDDFRIESLGGQALALFEEKRPQDAIAAASAALALARLRQDKRRQLAMLQILAKLHIPKESGEGAGTSDGAWMPYLQEALDLAKALDDPVRTCELLVTSADACAQAGNYTVAYENLLQANAARQRLAELTLERQSRAIRARSQIELLQRAAAGSAGGSQSAGNTTAQTQNDLFAADIRRASDPIGLLRKRDEPGSGLLRLVARVSHQMRQPVHAMNLYLGTLQSAGLQETVLPVISSMKQCAGIIDDIFLSLLDLACLHASAMQPHIERFPIMPLLSRVASEFAPRAEQREIEFRLVPSCAWVECDPVLLEKMLRHVTANAMTFATPGRLLVGCRRKGARLFIAIHAEQAAGGPVMQDESRAPTVDLELRLEVALHLGKLLSVPIVRKPMTGGNSLMTIELPLLKNRTTRAAQAFAAAAVELAGKFVVVVDDDETVLHAMQTLLEHWHCIVIAACSQVDVLEKLSYAHRAPDALICDYRLGANETGLDLINTLRSEFNQEIPALVITGEAALKGIHEAAARDIRVLRKPISPDVLLDALQRLPVVSI